MKDGDAHEGLALRPPKPFRRLEWSIAAVVLVLAAVAATVALTLQLRDDVATWSLVGLAFLAVVGAFSLVGLLVGLVHVGGAARHRALFDGLADAIDDAFAITDDRGRVSFTNAAYRRLLANYGAPRPVGVEILYAGHPEISDRIYRLAVAARDRQAGSEEFRLPAGSTAPGGRPTEPVWMKLSVVPIAVAQGHYSLWRLTDISSDRRRQENAFARLQYIISYLDHAPAGFFSTDQDGRIVYVNATLATWLGLDLEKTTDGSLKLSDMASPAGRQIIMGVAPEAGQERTDVFDIDLLARTGQSVPVRIIHRTDFDGEGRQKPSRSLVLRREHGETATGGAHQAELQLSRLVNNAPIGIARVNGQGKVTNANVAFLRLSPAAKRGANLVSLAAASYRKALQETLASVQGGNSGVIPVDVALEGEQGRSVQMFVVPAESDGTDKEAIVYAVETTEHRALEIQFAQSQKMQAIGQLAGGVAHDFNNVLTAIIGFSDLLLARHRPSDPAFADIMNIKQNANRAANLVRQLLAFSRRQTLAARDPVAHRRDLGSRKSAWPAARREGGPEGHPRARSRSRQDRRQPVRAGDREPCRERQGCDAERRHADRPHRQRHPR